MWKLLAGLVMVIIAGWAIITLVTEDPKQERSEPSSTSIPNDGGTPSERPERTPAPPVDTVPFVREDSGKASVTPTKSPATEERRMHPNDVLLIDSVAKRVGRPIPEIKALVADANALDLLRRTHSEVMPRVGRADEAVLNLALKIKAQRLESGDYESLPTFAGGEDGTPRRSTVPHQEPGQYVVSGVRWDPVLKQDLRNIVRIRDGESDEFDEARRGLTAAEEDARVMLEAALNTIRQSTHR